MGIDRHSRAWMLLVAVTGGLLPAAARAGDRVEVVVSETTEHDGNDTADLPGTAAPPGSAATTTTVVVNDGAAPSSAPSSEPSKSSTLWYGLSLGAVTMPLSRTGSLSTTQRLNSNPLRACIGSGDRRACTGLRGADLRLQLFSAQGPRSYPRFIGYLRTGFEAGQARLDPRTSGGYQRGEATGVAYTSVPVWVGFSLYAFKRFPVRPFVGLGMGADILQLRYARNQQPALRDRSVRAGFEVHGGLEARITNYVALTAEVKQQWTARRKLAGVPDFSNSGFTVMTGLSVSIPTDLFSRINRDRRGMTKVTHVSTTLQPPAARPPRSTNVGWAGAAQVDRAPMPQPPTIVVAPTVVVGPTSTTAWTPAAPSAVAPSAVAPSAVAPSAVAPSPVAPSPVAPLGLTPH